MPKGMYSSFATDEKIEKEGIYLEFETFRLLMARAGGANKKFSRSLAQATKPYRRAIESDTMGEELSNTLMRKVYARSIVLAWEVKDENGEWVSGIEGRDGAVIPYSKEAVEEVFINLPELFTYVVESSRKTGLYLDDIREIEAGN